MSEEHQTIEEVARKVLAKDYRARQDTKWFVIQVLRELGIKMFIDYRDLQKMPSFESILKTRRVIMNQKNEFNDTIAEEGVTYGR